MMKHIKRLSGLFIAIALVICAFPSITIAATSLEDSLFVTIDTLPDNIKLLLDQEISEKN